MPKLGIALGHADEQAEVEPKHRVRVAAREAAARRGFRVPAGTIFSNGVEPAVHLPHDFERVGQRARNREAEAERGVPDRCAVSGLPRTMQADVSDGAHGLHRFRHEKRREEVGGAQARSPCPAPRSAAWCRTARQAPDATRFPTQAEFSWRRSESSMLDERSPGEGRVIVASGAHGSALGDVETLKQPAVNLHFGGGADANADAE